MMTERDFKALGNPMTCSQRLLFVSQRQVTIMGPPQQSVGGENYQPPFFLARFGNEHVKVETSGKIVPALSKEAAYYACREITSESTRIKPSAKISKVTVQATCITLTAMSGDRCYITVYPLKSLHHRTPRVAKIVSLCIWIGSLILSTPILMYQRIEEGYWYGPRQYCMERFPSKTHERAFILYQFIAAYLLPVLTISFCYGMMVKRVGQPTVEPVDNNYQVKLLSERTIRIRSKVSKMVVVIVLLFALCWGPIQIFVLFQSFYPNFRATYATYKIKTWANCMSYANSSVNPIVYGFMGASFQKSFWKTFPFLYRHKVRDSSMASRTANAEIKFVAAEEGNNNNDAN
ncbi:KISS1 receptor a isoform 3-T3 [Syngnathus typhle]